uniref:PEHE domain-containing protein n=3 Tax=Timema TaxID=61471 RepID=A0A7R9H248_TIMCR|nr:unnamed protein product [Timema cristinae]
MSNASPVVNGENTGEVKDFKTDASVNMVAAIHDHISCAKPVTVDTFVPQDVKAGVVTYSCELDHMYASLNEGENAQDNTEVKHLKELLLLHLDLIQQQSEQLVTKDKQLSSLRQENETLRQRLERMDRRVTLQKHQKGTELLPLAVSYVNPPAISPPFSMAPSVIISTSSLAEVDSKAFQVEIVDSNTNNATGASVVSNQPSADIGLCVTPRTWAGAKRRKRELDNTSASGSSGPRKRFASWTSSVNSDAVLVPQDVKNSVAKENRYSRRVEKKGRMKGCKKESIRTVDFHYHTDLGEPNVPFTVEEPVVNGKLDIDVEEKYKSRVNAVGMKDLRNVCGKTLMDRVSNEWVLKECGLKRNLIGHYKISVLHWFGHVKRMSMDQVTKQMYEGRSPSVCLQPATKLVSIVYVATSFEATATSDQRARPMSTLLREQCGCSCNTDQTFVPTWRIKSYTSCYSMEGTENLDDEVFLKRHQRLEVDERRRKRWDVQRIREQRQIERLKLREIASSRRGSVASRHTTEGEEPVLSYCQQPDDVEKLEVENSVPLSALGTDIPNFPPSEFSLPWHGSARSKGSSYPNSLRRRDQRR